MPYLSASEVMFHEEALYQVYVPLPLYVSLTTTRGHGQNTVRSPAGQVLHSDITSHPKVRHPEASMQSI